MSSEYRVQLEDENGSVLYILFQTPDASRANDFSEEVEALNDKFSTDHNVNVREYKYEYRVGSDDGEWVLVEN